MDNLANSLALGISNRSASLLGQTVGGDVKSGLTLYQGEPVLRLRLPLDRAKASLSRALESEGFVKWGQSEGRVGLSAGLCRPGVATRLVCPHVLRRKAQAPAKPDLPWNEAIKHLDPAAAPPLRASLGGFWLGNKKLKAIGCAFCLVIMSSWC